MTSIDFGSDLRSFAQKPIALNGDQGHVSAWLQVEALRVGECEVRPLTEGLGKRRGRRKDADLVTSISNHLKFPLSC